MGHRNSGATRTEDSSGVARHSTTPVRPYGWSGRSPSVRAPFNIVAAEARRARRWDGVTMTETRSDSEAVGAFFLACGRYAAYIGNRGSPA